MAEEKEMCTNGDCASQGEDETYYCMQSETTKEILEKQEESNQLVQRLKGSQIVVREAQEHIKSVLEVMNGSLGRLFKLYEKQEDRLNDGDKLFQEIKAFMQLKNQANGYTEDGLKEVKQDIKKLTESFINIEKDLAEVKVYLREKKDAKKRNVSNRDKLLIGIGLVIATQFIIFLVKTFKWGI